MMTLIIYQAADPTTDTVISPTVALQRLSARDKKRG
jgi:hypothetical protein